MARAVPVTRPKEVEDKEAETVRTDPRRPASEAEYVPNEPKSVTKLPNGTVVEDY